MSLGWPRKSTPGIDKTIILTMKRNRFTSNIEIGDQFQLSKETIRRRGMENKIRSRLATINKLTQRHKNNRIRWCGSYKNVNFDDWIFSDECSFEIQNCSSAQRSFIHTKNGEKYYPYCVINVPAQSRKN